MAKAHDLVPLYDATGLFRPGADDDWRAPDSAFAPPEVLSHRGIEGAASLAVEILSPPGRDVTEARLVRLRRCR